MGKRKREKEIKKKRKILYLHGFMSGSGSKTVMKLRKHYGHLYDFIVPDLDCDIVKSLDIVNGIIAGGDIRLIIGNSLGGFYALLCDNGEIPVIVVNPCVNPCEHLLRYLDKELEYHCKRNDGAVAYRLDKDLIDRFGNYDLVGSIKRKANLLDCLLSVNDEILGDSHLALLQQIQDEEEEGHQLNICKGDFGHRLYPHGICLLDMIIYETLTS